MENNQSIRSGRAVLVTNNGSDLHGGHSGSYDSFFNSIPPGYRFKPLDEEPSDGYNLFSNTNAMGSDGLFKEEPFPTILPPQNDQHLYLPNQNSLQFNGYQPHQQLWG
ncbi:hypothetical protein D8674_029322 [Pyrus ussuriensis x Pyrus communis]|uniref:Uncharacterized protein n=1 Tax=Pyrus ussuriensis x Pyrus communis TaxID=2448454 RepID=A0A5N5HYQ4_9ROSA|nr:hypothetical protein D8674_029322 [Pyrus ussuriensis x Pyrus communis]